MSTWAIVLLGLLTFLVGAFILIAAIDSRLGALNPLVDRARLGQAQLSTGAARNRFRARLIATPLGTGLLVGTTVLAALFGNNPAAPPHITAVTARGTTATVSWTGAGSRLFVASGNASCVAKNPRTSGTHHCSLTLPRGYSYAISLYERVPGAAATRLSRKVVRIR